MRDWEWARFFRRSLVLWRRPLRDGQRVPARGAKLVPSSVPNRCRARVSLGTAAFNQVCRYSLGPCVSYHPVPPNHIVCFFASSFSHVGNAGSTPAGISRGLPLRGILCHKTGATRGSRSSQVIKYAAAEEFSGHSHSGRVHYEAQTVNH
jgi:hypothetical protein